VLVVFLLWLTRSPEVLKNKDAAQAVYGLKAGALAVGLFAVPVIAGAVGLWMRKRWARWVAAIPNVVFVVAMLWDPMFEGERIDSEDAIMIATFVAFTVLLLLPALGRAVRQNTAAPAAS
jgi:uncharacterized membrane protein (DUF2068 family)